MPNTILLLAVVSHQLIASASKDFLSCFQGIAINAQSNAIVVQGQPVRIALVVPKVPLEPHAPIIPPTIK